MKRKFDGIEDLNKVGVCWFVMEKYNEVIDPTFFKNVGSSYNSRKIIYEKNRENHLDWIEWAYFYASLAKIKTNEFDVSGAQIKNMAKAVYDYYKNKKVVLEKTITEIPDIKISTKF